MFLVCLLILMQVRFLVLQMLMNLVQLLIWLCGMEVVFGICRVVICFFGLLVGLEKILNFIFFNWLVMFINFSGMCRLGLFELQWCMVFLNGMCGNLLNLIFSIFLNSWCIIFLVMLMMLFLLRKLVLMLIWVNFGWWLVCRFLLWKYLVIWQQ